MTYIAPPTVFYDRLKQIQYRARKSKIAYNLTEQWALDRWDAQQGKCFYIGLPMRLQTGRHPLGLSFDRMDSNGGYTMGNVLMCSYCANMFKSDMTPQQFAHVMVHMARRVKEMHGEFPDEGPLPNPFT